MGSIIRQDTKGELTAALTETGKGGLLSKGYLKDAPAREYVGEGETPVFVLTDDTEGVERHREGNRTSIEPARGYRAITVLTDRRVIVLVGNAADGGDERITLPLREVTSATATGSVLEIEMTSGVTWRCHATADGLEDVAGFARAAAETWRDLEETLGSAKRRIVAATDHRDAGDYDAALAAIRTARDEIEGVRARVAEFGTEWPADAATDRVDQVRDRCLATAAAVRVDHARAAIDEGETHWRDGEYERARDAFEEARESYEAVRALAPRHRTGVDDVERSIDRLERRTEQLDDAPLRNAIDADRRARETDPSLDALEALADARERYAVVLELDRGGERRRFAGDRDRIREQREDVTDRFVETALEVGTDALEAGEWHRDTGQVALAREELERAIEALDRGCSVATEERPARADELRKRRSAAAHLLSDLDGDDDTCEERSRGDGPNGAQPRAGHGEALGPAADAAAADGGVTHAAEPGASPTAVGGDESGSDALGELSATAFERLVTTVLEAEGWRPEPTASTACDYLATDGEDDGNLAVRALPNEAGEPIGPETVRECATLAASVPSVERVMIATTRPLTDAARAAARSQDVEVLDADALAASLGGTDGNGLASAVAALED